MRRGRATSADEAGCLRQNTAARRGWRSRGHAPPGARALFRAAGSWRPYGSFIDGSGGDAGGSSGPDRSGSGRADDDSAGVGDARSGQGDADGAHRNRARQPDAHPEVLRPRGQRRSRLGADHRRHRGPSNRPPRRTDDDAGAARCDAARGRGGARAASRLDGVGATPAVGGVGVGPLAQGRTGLRLRAGDGGGAGGTTRRRSGRWCTGSRPAANHRSSGFVR